MKRTKAQRECAERVRKRLAKLAQIPARRLRRRLGGLCPICGKLIAYRFPLHDCTPKL